MNSNNRLANESGLRLNAPVSAPPPPKFRRFRVFFADSVPRGLALFFGLFSLLNLAGNLLVPGFDANLWWIDLRFLPTITANALLIIVSLLLIAFAIRPPIAKRRQFLTAASALAVAFLAGMNAYQFYEELIKGHIQSDFPVPLSLIVCASFLSIVLSAFRHETAVLYSSRAWGIILVLTLCVGLFPVLQVFCFGKTDYRRGADVIVVLGARAYANGEPSDALADRVRTACELYKDGLAKKIIMSGGPGDGAIHETESMTETAVKLGVAREDILSDQTGLNTQATVDNTAKMFDQLHAKRILVVSHFYHLPRIKMTYQRDGWEVWTVPAKEKYFLRETPYMIAREVAALWVYYLRPLRRGVSAA